MGIGIFLKSILPISLYVFGIWALAISFTGKTKWALYLGIFLIPLRNVIEKIQTLPLGNQFIDILLLGVLLGLFMNSKNNKESSTKSPINTISLTTIVYMILSLIWGGMYLYGGFSFDIHDSRVQDCKNFILMPVIYFMVFRSLQSKKDIWSLFYVLCFSIFIADYYTINQIREHSSLISREQIKGTFQFLGPNEVAAFFNQYTVILLGALYGFKKSKLKTFLFILVIINIYSILFLYSRGAYAGLIAGLIIIFAFKDKKLLLPLILILCLWNVILPQKVVERILETKTETGELDASSQRRIDIWEQALKLFASNPVAGIGFGSFRHLGLDLGDTHNIYVKILTEQGLFGITIFLATLFFFIREGYILYQKGDDDMSKALGLGFFCSIFTLMVNNFFGDRWSYLEPNTYIWVFAGMVTKLNSLAQTPEKASLNRYMSNNPSSKSLPQKGKKKLRYYDI